MCFIVYVIRVELKKNIVNKTIKTILYNSGDQRDEIYERAKKKKNKGAQLS